MARTRNNRNQFALKLAQLRGPGSATLPDRSQIETFIGEILGILFPHFDGSRHRTAEQIDRDLRVLEALLVRVLSPLQQRIKAPVEEVAAEFFEQLPRLHEGLLADAQAIFEGDPAASGVDEVMIAYPGFFAIAIYRLAHEFYRMRVPVFPRMLAEHAHERTGIDIHPGATIGRSFFIDHGTGIVIGETTVIKDHVKIYQGVTLGALSVDKSRAHTKRHPTIQDRVVIYSNATILGGDTVIGESSTIGGNVWLTNSVPAHSTVYHQSEVTVKAATQRRIKKIKKRK